jgi:hypothetical protein
MYISQCIHLCCGYILFGELLLDERGTMLQPKIVLPTVSVVATKSSEDDIG